MKIFVRIVVIILLLFNGTGALYGGISLVSDPTGSGLHLPLSFLEHTPFRNYMIPGIVLLCVNGLFSFVTLFTILFKYRKSSLFVIAQGILLGGWIIVQIILVRVFYPPLHVTFLLTGAAFLACGFYMYHIGITPEKISQGSE
ncbi:MAG: hypothetical protein WCE64_14670 [Bacteroidales bacterium]